MRNAPGKLFIPWVLRFVIVALLCQSRALGQEQKTVSEWHGFKKVSFELKGRHAFCVKPKKALPDNPWVWRAYFPGWKIDMDLILLRRGFHIAYIDASDLYGSPTSMVIWDDFYGYLTNERHFSRRVALEAVSRGGLYALAWAKRHPDEVSCIYAESPVCDFKSWPGGKGKGIGSPQDWAKLLRVYGFSEEQALRYNDNPIDNLKRLASRKVPILCVINLKDHLVPPEENTLVLISRYVRDGGPISVYPVSKGPQTLWGHHFPIEHPEYFADFIYEHSVR